MDTIVKAFLAAGEYSSVEDWAKDSDYHQDGDGIWRSDEGCAVDIEGCIEGAIEASGFKE